MFDRSLTTIEAATIGGISYRQLDHLVRTGVISPAYDPAPGEGNVRRWAPEQIRLIRLIAVLRRHGARATTLRATVLAMEGWPEAGWQARVVVTLDGRVLTPLAADANGYIVDLAHCQDYLDLILAESERQAA